MTETQATTYPAWFIHSLSRAITAVEALDKALGEILKDDLSYQPTMYVETIPLMYEGDKIGTLHWLDDQWQFEPDVEYWGLKKKDS